MVLTCNRCGNINPKEAAFCFFDGIVLQNGIGQSVVKNPELPFPFIFPDGRKCIRYDELVLAFFDEWGESKNLLKDKSLSQYFQKIGRADLAYHAEKCRVFPNSDLGLDELINRLPISISIQPELQVETERINLGILNPTDSRDLYIQLKNTGLGLIKGNAVIHCPDFWLTFGDAAGANQKALHFINENKLHLKLQNKRLRASDKNLNAKIVIDTNGGTKEIIFSATIPVTPFAKGCLAGAISPRKLASLAKQNPSVAALLFEDNSVQDWYRSNGWTYPVPGPPASGVAAVQQFFEALGLVEAPKVEIEPKSIECSGFPGDKISLSFTVFSEERKHVYAHASSHETPWLHCSPAIINKNKVVIPIDLVVPDVSPGQHEGRIQIFSNGGKLFKPRIYLAVKGNGISLPPPIPNDAKGMANNFLGTINPSSNFPPMNGAQAPPIPPELDQYRTRGIPAIFLALLLFAGNFVALARDILFSHTPSSTIANTLTTNKPDMDPQVTITTNDTEVEISFGEGLTAKPTAGRANATSKGTQEPHMSFGIQTKPTDNSKPKLLVRDPKGFTNNSVLRINGNDWFFGQGPLKFSKKSSPEFMLAANKHYTGHWLKMKQLIADSKFPFLGSGYSSLWAMTNPSVEITQTLRIIPGAQTNKLDTVLVRYRIENRGNKNLNIGFRFLLDTFIGTNDAVPFLIPGESELCSTSLIMEHNSVPDFLQALENNNLNSPGTVANISLQNIGLEKPDKLTLGCWPDYRLQDIIPQGNKCKEAFTLWDVPVASISTLKPPDSALTLYWNPKEIQPFKAREVGFSYGLGTFAGSQGQGQLALTAGGSFIPNGEFTLTAYVSGHTSADSLDLKLPLGFKLLDGQEKTPLRTSQSKYAISWKLKAPPSEGESLFKIESSKGFKEQLSIQIKKPPVGGIFG